MSVFEDGVRDYRSGKDWSDNPYNESVYPDWHKQWKQGWLHGQQIEQNKTNQ